MLLNNYQADITAIVQKYVNQEWVLSFTFAVDARSDYVGFIQGSLEFVEGSRLFFKEYVDLQESIEKLSYSFHYQDRNNNWIFRYDNAKHRPDLGYIDHKHIKNKIIPSEVPNIEKIILEIIRENYAQKL
jgi:hypothetical protein